MKKLAVQLAIIASLLSLLPSCKGHQANGPQPYGILYVNGTSVNGGVEIGNVRIYYLYGIRKDQQYAVRTAYAPDGVLSADTYTSFADYKAGLAPLVSSTTVTTQTQLPGTQGTVEQLYSQVLFQAHQDGDYVVVLQGVPATTAAPDVNTLNFYDLRIMSATGTALSSFGTATIDLNSSATATGTVESGKLLAYSGETITPPGTYSILLTASTYTISYPQVFVYQDSTLSLKKLLYSAISVTYTDPITSVTAREFQISSFSSTPTFTVLSTDYSFTCKIDNVPFTSVTGNGPYIMLKGVSKATYTLTVGP